MTNRANEIDQNVTDLRITPRGPKSKEELQKMKEEFFAALDAAERTTSGPDEQLTNPTRG